MRGIRNFIYIACLCQLLTLTIFGDDIRLSALFGRLQADGVRPQNFSEASIGFSKEFDSSGLGAFSWQFKNTTNGVLRNAKFAVFLDADIDYLVNTHLNEYGNFISLSPPPNSPNLAIPPSAWEIDEPGVDFGDIFDHFIDISLDNNNGVPSNNRNDVALALQFQLGDLTPGQSMSFKFFISRSNIGGLSQTDPNSNITIYFNGYSLNNGDDSPTNCTSPIITLQPRSQSVIDGNPFSLTSSSSGAPLPHIQWQSANQGSDSFINIPGETNIVLSLNASLSVNGRKYRALFNNACGSALSDAAVITVVNRNPELVINEFRSSGPAENGDWYIKLYNNTESPVRTNGRVIAISGLADSVPLLIELASNLTIPPKGHYLIAGHNFSLSALTSPDQIFQLPESLNIDGLGVFNGLITPVNRIDSIGFNTLLATDVNAYFIEGAPLPATGSSTVEHSWTRKIKPDGAPKDTENNREDFLLLTPKGELVNGVPSTPGAPSPQGLNSPVQSNDLAPSTLFEPSVSSAAPPNRERKTTPVANGSLGTLAIRRTITNNAPGPITKIRFRVIDITNSPTGAQAELRALSSVDAVINGKQVRGLTLEQPPAQPNGGGLNSTLTTGVITLESPLPVGQAINVEFLLGVMRAGSFRFFVNVEILP